MLTFFPYLWPYYLLMALFGLVLGSFANVVICRVPEGGWKSVASGRSRCPSCNTQLKAFELVPVISFVFLRGRCRTCGKRIAFRYPLVELLGGLGFFMAALRYGFSVTAPLIGLFFCILLCVAFIDADTQYIPDALCVAIAVLAVASFIIAPSAAALKSRLIGAVCVSVPVYLLAKLTGGFGMGDAKLMAASGLLLGWQITLAGFLIAVLAGGIAGAVLLATKKAGRKTAIAFGPYLCAGLFIAVCFLQYILLWYASLLV